MGGLLGIGIGFSFISLVEMLYFFGFRRLFDGNARPDVTKVQVIDKETRSNYRNAGPSDQPDNVSVLEQRHALKMNVGIWMW